MKRDESQNVEYKESWHDKYLAWICGYANAQGGTIYFGIEDGTKKPVGVKNVNSLMESIPNKIRDTMGIVADVALLRKSAEDFVRVNSRHSWHKLPRTRVEFVEYPERSVHEALVNAFIHRDYLVTGSEVHVDIFDDRIEITSPGGMPGERKIEDFDIGCIPSIRRNPLLADMCERLRIMERRGSGFKKIFEDYTENFVNPSKRTPILESHSAYFRVTLPNIIYGFTDEQLIAAAKDPKAEVAPPVVTPVATPVAKPSETLIDEVQRKVLSVLCNGTMSTAELASRVGISQPKNMRRRYLRLLLDMGFVEYTIPNKPNSKQQQYRLTTKGHELINRQDATHDASEVINGGLNGTRGGLDGGLNANRGGLNGGINEVLIKAIQEHPGKRVLFYKGLLSAGSRTIERAIATLIAAGRVEHRGSKKTGGYYVTERSFV